ncbi:MAG: rod shape-determining protein MreC [Clostridia bacterium]|nr:rod shape-determining protein MreC [Clostridia bacterium]
MRTFCKSRGFKALLCLAAFLVGLLGYAAATRSGLLAGAVLSPLQSALSSATTGVGDFLGGLFSSSSALSEENAALRKELARLRTSQAELDELRRQNALYKSFLGVKVVHPDYEFAAARVIATDPAEGSGHVTVNAGTQSGVAVGNAVVTPDGLVGIVCEVGLNYAKIRTLLDPSLTLRACDSRTRADGLTGGTVALAQRGYLQLTRLDRAGAVAAGDLVLTYGGRYPEGLLLGEIESLSLDSDGLTKTALVRPFVDVRTVSEVLIITHFEGVTE